MLCVSAVNGAYSIIELSGSELSWVTSTEATKAKPQRVVIGRLSVKLVLFLVMLKRHSWRGTSFFNPHIPPFFNSVEPQWIFPNYSPLCENSRANQAWRMSSPTRTFNSRDISFVTPFLCQEIQTNCQAWRRQPDCRLHYTQHVFSQVLSVRSQERGSYMGLYDRNSEGFKCYFTVTVWTEMAASNMGLPGLLGGVLRFYEPTEKYLISSFHSYVVTSPYRGK